MGRKVWLFVAVIAILVGSTSYLSFAYVRKCNDLDEANLTISNFVDEVDGLEQEIVGLEQDITILTSSLEDAEAEVNILEVQYQGTLSQLEDTILELDGTRHLLDLANSQVSALRIDVANLHDDLDDMEDELARQVAYSQTLIDAANQAAYLQDAVNTLTIQLNTLQSQLEYANTCIDGIYWLLYPGGYYVSYSEAIALLNAVINIVNAYYGY